MTLVYQLAIAHAATTVPRRVISVSAPTAAFQPRRHPAAKAHRPGGIARGPFAKNPAPGNVFVPCPTGRNARLGAGSALLCG